MKKRKIFKKSFCAFLLLFMVVAVIGCKTTPPTLGYIQPSKEITEAYGNRPGLPYDGVFLDYGKDGGHTTKRVVFLYDPNGNLIHGGENLGVDSFGRVLSNAGVFIGTGTAIASPFWGYFGQKTRDANNINISGGSTSATSDATGGAGGTSSSTATSSSGP